MSILVLEDEPCVMNLLRLVLNGAGYSVIEADCAEQAMSCANLTRIRCLIADVTAPCFGISVSADIMASNPMLKIVLTSGYPTENWSDRDAALWDELPSDSVRVLSKPFRPCDVLSAVNDLIGSPSNAPRYRTVSG